MDFSKMREVVRIHFILGNQLYIRWTGLSTCHPSNQENDCVFLSMSSGRTETEEPISGSRSARRRLLPVNLSPCPSHRSICYISVSAACWYIVRLKPTWIFIVSHLSCVTVGPLVLMGKMGCRLIEKASFWVWSELMLWARCVSPTANESSPSHFCWSGFWDVNVCVHARLWKELSACVQCDDPCAAPASVSLTECPCSHAGFLES